MIAKVFAIRAAVFMSEQDCPYEEEFDGNDFAAATHILGFVNGEAAAVLRVRFFADFAKIDSSNQFLWRMNRSRLDAECVRDSILQVTGLADTKMGGPSAKQFVEKPDAAKAALLATDGKHLWNSGMFVFTARTLLEELEVHAPEVLNTVRRAVKVIANEGTVARQIGRGTFLNSAPSELATIIQRVTGVSPADLMAVRMIVEPQAAAIAAKNASLSDLQAIADAHQQATQALQTNEFEHWDTQFHQRLFAATRNELLVSIHGILQVIRSRNPWIELKRKTFSENRRLHYCEQHANVVAALENRDADGAAQAMLGHIEAIEIALFGRR